MKRGTPLRRRLVFLGGLALYAAILVLLVRRAGVQQLHEVPLDATSVLVVFAVSLTHITLRSHRWYLLVRPFRPQRYSWARNFYIFAVGLGLSALTPARVGELVKGHYLARHGIPIAQGIGIVAVERVFDLLCMFAFVFALAPFAGITWGLGLAVVGTLGLATGIALLCTTRGNNWVVRLCRQMLPERERVVKLFVDFAGAFHAFRDLRAFGGVLALSLCVWGIEFSKLYVAIRLLGGEVSIAAVLLAYPLSIMAGLASLLPFAEGVVTGSLTLLIQRLGGRPGAVVTAATFLDRAMSLLPLVLILVFHRLGWRRATPGGVR